MISFLMTLVLLALVVLLSPILLLLLRIFAGLVVYIAAGFAVALMVMELV